MAGWFPDRGCDDFYTAVWEDEAIAAQLEARLTDAGALAVLQLVAS